MTTPNNQPTPPKGYRSPTEDEIEHGAIIPMGTLKSMIDGSWQETKAAGLKFDNIFIYAIPITPTVPSTGDERERCCMATFELGNGEYVSPCHLPKGHEGDHKGTCLGSNLIWPQGFSSEEELVLRQRAEVGEATNEKGGEQGQELPDTETLVRADIFLRQQKGLSKYGKTVANNPLSVKDWLQHAYEECLDQAVYLKRAIQELER